MLPGHAARSQNPSPAKTLPQRLFTRFLLVTAPCLARQTSCRYSASPRPSACTLAITLDRQPAALRSTRNRPRRAVRRGAPWPAERPSAASSARASLARQVASDPSLHGSRTLQAPSTGTQLSVDRRPSARSLGVMAQDGPDAGHAVVTPCPRPRLAFGVQCSVRASSVDTCLSTGVQCPVRRPSVQVSSVRRPVSDVRCPCPLGPTEVRSWSAAAGQAAARLGWAPGSAWSPAV
jgi:hypothetical protein